MKAAREAVNPENQSFIEENRSDDFGHTFCHDTSLSKLQVKIYQKPNGERCREWTEGSSFPSSTSSPHDLLYFAKQTNACQIFSVGQKRSYSRLTITHELFQYFIETNSVFPNIWDFVQPFGFRTRHSDMGNPPFRVHLAHHNEHRSPRHFECAYSFRYAILNHRTDMEDPLPDYDRWSIRQTVVYQQYIESRDTSMFLLVAPSLETKNKMEHFILSRSADTPTQALPSMLHRIMISTHHESWRLYIRDLESYLQQQSDRVTLSIVNGYLMMPFVDRQRLKMIEDRILDLRVIFDSLLNTVLRLRRQSQFACLGDRCVQCLCQSLIDDLEEQLEEIQINMKRVEILHSRAQSTAQLVSDALSYENAQITNLNAKSLQELAQESKEENSKMRMLTERSTRDAAAVKILTVITLIYLPVTVVASIFSSQLIQVDDKGRISVISDSWWFVVVSVPLTVLTFLLWRFWLSHSVGKTAHPKEDHNKEHQALTPSIIREGRIAGFRRRLHSLPNKESHLELEPLP